MCKIPLNPPFSKGEECSKFTFVPKSDRLLVPSILVSAHIELKLRDLCKITGILRTDEFSSFSRNFRHLPESFVFSELIPHYYELYKNSFFNPMSFLQPTS